MLRQAKEKQELHEQQRTSNKPSEPSNGNKNRSSLIDVDNKVDFRPISQREQAAGKTADNQLADNVKRAEAAQTEKETAKKAKVSEENPSENKNTNEIAVEQTATFKMGSKSSKSVFEYYDHNASIDPPN